MTPDEFVASYFDHRNGVNLKNPDQAKFLAPWIHRIRATPPQSAILPWIEAGQQAENSTYFCSVFNAAQNAELEAQIRAFLGRSHLDFVGRPIALSKTSHPDMLVADLTGGWVSRPIFFPAMAANLSASKTSMPRRTGGSFSAGGVIVAGPGRVIAGGGNLAAALVGLLTQPRLMAKKPTASVPKEIFTKGRSSISRDF